MRSRMLLAAIAAMLTAASVVPAAAQRVNPQSGEALALTDVLTVTKAYPNLTSEIRLRLIAAGRKKEDITCAAPRLGSSWTHLAGKPVAPYSCPIGRIVLTVTADRTIYDRSGYKLSPTDPQTPGRATRVVEQRLKWTWK